MERNHFLNSTNLGLGRNWTIQLSAVAVLGWAAACSASHEVALDARENSSAAQTDPQTNAVARARDGRGADRAAVRSVGHPDSEAEAPAGTGRGGDPENYVFSQDSVRNYEIEVDPDDWAHINDTAYLEEYVPGRLTFEGEVFDIALRFKGFRGSLYNCFTFDEEGHEIGRRCERMPIKVSFDHYDEDARFFGLKKLNFHVLRNDPSLMRDRLSYAVFRASGVPAPRAVHATLSVNGEALGLYGLIEQVDGRFARNAFEEGGEGNIYKERWPTTSTDEDYYISGLEANKDDPDVSAMQRFAEDLRAATDENIEDVLREHTNFEALMRYLAIDRAINHWDGPLAFRCRLPEDLPVVPPEVLEAQTPALGWQVCQNKNYFWYEEPESDKLWLVPWDMDVSWNSFSQFPDWNTSPETCDIRASGRPPRCDALVNWFATTLRPHYAAAGRELLTEGALRQPVLQTWLDRWYEQIATHIDPATIAFGSFLLGSEIQNRLSAFTEEVTRESR